MEVLAGLNDVSILDFWVRTGQDGGEGTLTVTSFNRHAPVMASESVILSILPDQTRWNHGKQKGEGKGKGRNNRYPVVQDRLWLG